MAEGETQRPLDDKTLQQQLNDYAAALESEFMVKRANEDNPQIDEELYAKTKKVLISKAPDIMMAAIELAISPSVKDATRASMVRWLLELMMSKRDEPNSAPDDPISDLLNKLKQKEDSSVAD